MDADAAAKVVQRLPDAYVARIFAIMPADSVGAILENLPAAYAARLTQDRPELNH
jgi:flagellar motility protein MotE (MotC chaperone)